MTDDNDNARRITDWRSLRFIKDIAPLPFITPRQADRRLSLRLRRPAQECGRRVIIPYFKMGGAIRYAKDDIELYYNSFFLGRTEPQYKENPFDYISTKEILLDHHGISQFSTLDVRTRWKFRQLDHGPQYQTYDRHVRYLLEDIIFCLGKCRRMDSRDQDKQREAEAEHIPHRAKSII